MTAERLKRGDHVRVRLQESDEWTPALVALASDTERSSVMLMLDGVVRSKHGLFCNALPLSIDYGKETVTSLFGDSYEIEVAS